MTASNGQSQAGTPAFWTARSVAETACRVPAATAAVALLAYARMSEGRWVGMTPPGVRRWTRLGSMKAMAAAAVEKEMPALEAILSMESRPMAASSVELEIGLGLAFPSHEVTKSPRPALRR